MPEQPKDYDLVALLEDLPAEGLAAGQVGTIVFTHGQGEAFEVEFPLEARSWVVATVPREALLKLRAPTRVFAAE